MINNGIIVYVIHVIDLSRTEFEAELLLLFLVTVWPHYLQLRNALKSNNYFHLSNKFCSALA